MVARFGTAATTAGLKVTTTIDSRLQAAANRAIRDTLMAYDERHGYRGPIATVELPGAGEGAESQAPPAITPEQLRALLDDYPTLLDYESAIVLARGRAQRAGVFRGAWRADDWIRRSRVGRTVHYRRHDGADADQRSPRC